MKAIGLAGDGSPLPRRLRPICGAKNRRGQPRAVTVEPGKHRCRLHGGLSIGHEPRREGPDHGGVGAEGRAHALARITEALERKAERMPFTVTGRNSEEAIERAIKEYEVPERERFRISVQREA